MREGEGMGGAHGNELVGVGRCNWPVEAQAGLKLTVTIL